MSDLGYRGKTLKDKEIVVEEKLTKPDGEEVVRRYVKGRYLGRGGFARVYEFKSQESRKSYAGKVISKLSLSKPA